MPLQLSSLSTGDRPRAGLTLIEMMVVLFIIALLGGIGFTMVPRLKQKGREDRAAADLIVIQQGLEAYRTKFGDYPEVPATLSTGLGDANAYLFNALNGRIGPRGDRIDLPPMLNNALLILETNALPQFDDDGPTTVDNRILDPWGRPYVYDNPRDKSGNWDAFGYKLYSLGSDGQYGTEDDIEAK